MVLLTTIKQAIPFASSKPGFLHDNRDTPSREFHKVENISPHSEVSEHGCPDPSAGSPIAVFYSCFRKNVTIVEQIQDLIEKDKTVS